MIIFINNRLLLVLVIIFTIFLCSLPFEADAIPSIREGNLFWLNAGPGASTAGIAIGTGMSLQINRQLFTFRYSWTEEVLKFGGEESIWDVGMLYGISTVEDYFHASVSGGLSLVGGKKQVDRLGFGDYVMKRYTTVGIPLETQLFVKPLTFLGIGIYGFANLNSEKSYSGALLALQIGKLR